MQEMQVLSSVLYLSPAQPATAQTFKETRTAECSTMLCLEKNTKTSKCEAL